ncbi:glycosyltransferase [Nesterenkonia populi]|uniref:glycosyltransferase n=1 Tax=Nesterenkonia populi TaxID=1591087 RepID=UPI0011BE61A8|nr:glycosyltransferase [Nesterenkonia populi]
MNPLFIGYTRFSVHQYNSGSFNATSRNQFSEEDYTNWLYADDRLAPRTEIFIDESLPQLAESSGECEIVHIVTISPSLPQKYRDALEHARSRYKFLRIYETKKRAAPSHPNLGLVRTFLAKRNMQGKVFGMYRLDDDDVLPIDFFARMTPYVDPGHVGYRVSLPQGIAAVRTGSGYVLPWTTYEAKSSAGFLSVHKFSKDGKNIHGLENQRHIRGHQNSDRNFPTVLDAREPGFFRARHASQDSTLESTGGPFYTRTLSRALEKSRASLDTLAKYYPHVKKATFDSIKDLPQKQNLLEQNHTCSSEEPILHDLDGAHILSGRLSRPLAKEETLALRVRTSGEPSSDSHTWKEAGFNADRATGEYIKPLHIDRSSTEVIAVIEPPHGAQVHAFTFEGNTDDLQLEELQVAPLT